MPSPRSGLPLTDIKRIVLDVLKPHKPSLVEMSVRLSNLKGVDGVTCTLDEVDQETERDRKSTRLNSSHSQISYAVFCLKKKKTIFSQAKGSDRASLRSKQN